MQFFIHKLQAIVNMQFYIFRNILISFIKTIFHANKSYIVWQIITK